MVLIFLESESYLGLEVLPQTAGQIIILQLYQFQKMKVIGANGKKLKCCWLLLVKLSSFNYRFINQQVTQQGLRLIAAKMAANLLIIQHFPIRVCPSEK